MPELLKNLYTENFIKNLADILSKHIKPFPKKVFIAKIFDADWQNKELKQRMRHITLTLHQYLPKDFKKAAPFLKNITTSLIEQQGNGLHFLYMLLPEYVELYGIDHIDTSIKLFEHITTFTSAEFAVRPFIIKYPEKMMQQMLKWSSHKDQYVRRLSSEGCRPRLPWAIALPEFKKDPKPILPILENLKCDEAITVNKSVANNLNDIAKDNPAIVLTITKKWKGKNETTDWIIRHGSRTLLKNGNAEALQHFGIVPVKDIIITKFKLSTINLKIGDTIEFSFELNHTNKKVTKLRINYAVYYVKSAGKLSKKIFKLAENNFEGNNQHVFNKKQRFTDFTTRKHFPGHHFISIIVNGNEVLKKKFMVTR